MLTKGRASPDEGSNQRSLRAIILTKGRALLDVHR